jgi:hypothetical protein
MRSQVFIKKKKSSEYFSEFEMKPELPVLHILPFLSESVVPPASYSVHALHETPQPHSSYGNFSCFLCMEAWALEMSDPRLFLFSD